MTWSKHEKRLSCLRLIKAYLLFRPNSTSKDIREWIVQHGFGLNEDFTPHQITTFINHARNEKGINWFNVESVETSHTKRWRVVEDEYYPYDKEV